MTITCEKIWRDFSDDDRAAFFLLIFLTLTFPNFSARANVDMMRMEEGVL